MRKRSSNKFSLGGEGTSTNESTNCGLYIGGILFCHKNKMMKYATQINYENIKQFSKIKQNRIRKQSLSKNKMWRKRKVV